MLAAVLACGLAPLALARSENPERQIELPLDQWLAAGEKSEFSGKLKIQEPFLTFQQRHRLRIFSFYDIRKLQRSGVKRDLHYVLKIANASGEWLRGESYSETRFDGPVKSKTLEIITEVNVLPGRYRVAAIMYDSEQKQRSVLFDTVEVPLMRDDPLPMAERDLPTIEFLPEFDRSVSQFGIGKLNLPVDNYRPLHIDLIFDVGAQWQHGNARFASLTASRQVQVANALADIRLRAGCVRLTAIDLLRQELLFERTDANAVDWFKMRSEILRRNLHTIGVDKLDAQRQVAPFLKSEVERILATTPGCSVPQGMRPKRVIIVLTSGVLFPPRTQAARVQPVPACACDIFYIRAAQVLPFDDVPGVLKDLAPRKIEAQDPRKFRRELRQLINQLEQISRS